jgi:hypothetical protein
MGSAVRGLLGGESLRAAPAFLASQIFVLFISFC